MSTESRTYDIYASLLNYKNEISVLGRPFINAISIPDDHWRRQQAYELLSAYYQNYSRDYRYAPEAGPTSSENPNDDIFESGDVAWLCERFKSKILGDEISVVIPGPRSLKRIPELTRKIADGDATLQPDLDALTAIQATVAEQQAYIQDWFEDNGVALSIDENELLLSYLGDCVYFIEWDRDEARPSIRTYDPGFYFPGLFDRSSSLQEDVQDRVVDRVIISWSEPDSESEDGDATMAWRDVFELRRHSDGTLHCWRQYGYYRYASGSTTLLVDYDDAELIEETSDGWNDIGIDFIPIVQIPNIKVQGSDFGMSNTHFLIAVFDSLMNAYTDLRKNAEHLGGGTVIATGEDLAITRDPDTKKPIPIEIEPGTMYFAGRNGSVTLLDTSTMQDALIKTIEKYETLIIRNSQITEIGAGTMAAQQVPSGYALTILAQPLFDKIAPMRLVRQLKYQKLFEMVQKLWGLFGSPEEKALFADVMYPVKIQFGKIIPTDEKTNLDELTLFQGLTDAETTLYRMKEEGYDIDPESIIQNREKKAAAQAEALMNQQMDAFGFRRAADGAQGGDGAGGGTGA
jgi:hypothetical protein